MEYFPALSLKAWNPKSFFPKLNFRSMFGEFSNKPLDFFKL